MSFLKRIFSFGIQKPQHDPTAPLTEIANKIDPLLEQTAQDIFYRYHAHILQEDLTYIVFAVWGARQDGELSDSQKQINGEILPVIELIMIQLGITSLSPQQDYAIRYLIRSLFISKIIFLKELAHKRICEQNKQLDTAGEPILPDDFFESFFAQDNERWKQWFGGDRGKRW